MRSLGVYMVPEIGAEPSKSQVYTPVSTPFFPCFFTIPDRIPDKIQGGLFFYPRGGEVVQRCFDCSCLDTRETEFEKKEKGDCGNCSLIKAATKGFANRQ